MSDPMWSESVYLDAVSPDGSLAVVVRLGRYPATETAWTWAHVFTPTDCVAFNDNRYPCTGEVVAVEEADATYAAGAVSFRRVGPRDAMWQGVTSLRVTGHAGSTAPDGRGEVPLAIDASFTPDRVLQGAGNLPGRTEEHGTVHVEARWGDARLDLDALGQWHEQHQSTPRFTVPFTYVTLRGPAATLVAVITPRGSGGILRRDGAGVRATDLRISPPAPVRTLGAVLEDGSTMTATVHTTYRYDVPILDRLRAGTIVAGTIDGDDVSGCVNDWPGL